MVSTTTLLRRTFALAASTVVPLASQSARALSTTPTMSTTCEPAKYLLRYHFRGSW